MSLFTFVYVSIATKEMSDDDLLCILKKARSNNAANGITGLLLYRDGFFIQAMEGEEDALVALFERVKQDPRHYNALLIYSNPIKCRRFGQWAMGFESPNFDTLKQVAGFSEFMRPHQPETYDEFVMSFKSEVDVLLDKFRH